MRLNSPPPSMPSNDENARPLTPAARAVLPSLNTLTNSAKASYLRKTSRKSSGKGSLLGLINANGSAAAEAASTPHKTMARELSNSTVSGHVVVDHLRAETTSDQTD